MADKNNEQKLSSSAATDETAVSKKSAKELKAEKAKAKAAKKANKAGFFRSVIAERKKITWYGGKQSIHSTIAVIVTMVVVAAIIGLIDWLLSQGVDLVSHIPELFM